MSITIYLNIRKRLEAVIRNNLSGAVNTLDERVADAILADGMLTRQYELDLLSQTIAETAAELGCENDNEAILQAIDRLKNPFHLTSREAELYDAVWGLITTFRGGGLATITTADQMKRVLDVISVMTPLRYQTECKTIVEGNSDRADAERFRALMRCGRIKMQGSSGVDPQTGERTGSNVHFGAELWPEPLPPEHQQHYEQDTKWGRACLRALADAILEAEAKING